MHALVTGASGFVGSALVRALLGAGNTVRAMVRETSDTHNLQGLHVERCYADLLNSHTLRDAVSGCDAVFHVAADYRLWVPDPDLMHAVNVIGTRELMRAALAEKVERIVYTSSVATLGWRDDGAAASEDTPAHLDDMIGHYKRSKFLAEREVIQLIDKEELPAVIVNPAAPIGPRDSRPTPTGKIVLDMLKRKMPAYVDTGLNVVHVDDVAQGHLAAYRRGKIGERYILGGDNMRFIEILRAIAECANVPCPKIRVPYAMLIPVALGAEAFAHLTGTTPRVTLDSIRMARHPMFFSSAKAEVELAYQHRPAIEALRDATAWYRSHWSL